MPLFYYVGRCLGCILRSAIRSFALSGGSLGDCIPLACKRSHGLLPWAPLKPRQYVIRSTTIKGKIQGSVLKTLSIQVIPALACGAVYKASSFGVLRGGERRVLRGYLCICAGRPPSGLRKHPLPGNSPGFKESFQDPHSSADDTFIVGDFDAAEVCALQTFSQCRFSSILEHPQLRLQIAQTYLPNLCSNAFMSILCHLMPAILCYDSLINAPLLQDIESGCPSSAPAKSKGKSSWLKAGRDQLGGSADDDKPLLSHKGDHQL